MKKNIRKLSFLHQHFRNLYMYFKLYKKMVEFPSESIWQWQTYFHFNSYTPVPYLLSIMLNLKKKSKPGVIYTLRKLGWVGVMCFSSHNTEFSFSWCWFSFEHVTQQLLHGRAADRLVKKQSLYFLWAHEAKRRQQKQHFPKPWWTKSKEALT